MKENSSYGRGPRISHQGAGVNATAKKEARGLEIREKGPCTANKALRPVDDGQSLMAGPLVLLPHFYVHHEGVVVGGVAGEEGSFGPVEFLGADGGAEDEGGVGEDFVQGLLVGEDVVDAAA